MRQIVEGYEPAGIPDLQISCIEHNSHRATRRIELDSIFDEVVDELAQQQAVPLDRHPFVNCRLHRQFVLFAAFHVLTSHCSHKGSQIDLSEVDLRPVQLGNLEQPLNEERRVLDLSFGSHDPVLVFTRLHRDVQRGRYAGQRSPQFVAGILRKLFEPVLRLVDWTKGLLRERQPEQVGQDAHHQRTDQHLEQLQAKISNPLTRASGKLDVPDDTAAASNRLRYDGARFVDGPRRNEWVDGTGAGPSKHVSLVQDRAVRRQDAVSYTHLRAHETRHDLV